MFRSEGMNMGRNSMKCAALIIVLAMTLVAFNNVSAGEPELSDSWSATYEKGTFRHGMFGGFNGGSADDFMAIYSEEPSNLTGKYETFLVLFDGQDGDIIWEKNFSNELEPVSIVSPVETGGKVNALICILKLTEIPVANTNYTTTMSLVGMVMIDGENGNILWTTNNFGVVETQLVSIDGEDVILAGVFNTFNTIEGGLYTIEPDTGHYRFTGIEFDTWLSNFLIDETPNRDDVVIIYGNQAIEAYEMGAWTMLWEYDFFDNDVYYSDGYSGLLNGDGTVAFHAGKGDAYNSLIVLDKITGMEISATNLTQTGVSQLSFMWNGDFTDDETTDYLAMGFADGNYSMIAIDGSNMNEMWRFDAEKLISQPESANLEIIDLDRDGTDDVLVTMDIRVLALSGETGEIIWEHELPAKPDYLILGDYKDGQPNLAYLSEGTVYCMNLEIPTSSNSIFVLIIGIIAILMIATAAIMLIRRRR